METAKLFNERALYGCPRAFASRVTRCSSSGWGMVVVLLPRRGSWQTLVGSLELFSEDFMEERGQPPLGQARAEARSVGEGAGDAGSRSPLYCSVVAPASQSRAASTSARPMPCPPGCQSRVTSAPAPRRSSASRSVFSAGTIWSERPAAR